MTPRSFSISRILGLDAASLAESSGKRTALQRVTGVLAGVAVVTICTGIGWLVRDYTNQAFQLILYLLGLVSIALLWGPLASSVAAVLSMLTFDFLFDDSMAKQLYTFRLHPFDLVVFSGMLGIAQLVAWLVNNLRAKTRTALNLAIEQVQLKEEADIARLEADMERTRSTLLSAVSHDLRTPLASIKMAAETLATEWSTLKPDESFEWASLLGEVEKLDRMLNNLLEITRLENGFIRLNKSWQPVEEVVGAVLTRLEGQKGKLPITVSLAKGLPLVLMDGVLIEQLLSNLLENAIRYAPGKPVVLSVDCRDDHIRVAISDSGSGVPKELQERVFDKFYRSPGAGDGGTGLGLAICKAIVKAHDGTIWVEEAPNGGAAFIFTIPTGGVAPSIPA
uniref:histidine kinase n=1 Tax=uncultured bacterium contig00038 TaxID=1181526 RepID=A0A806KK73_9BACT|nr:osmosensitive K+ channel histidine kinase KdpD [uncultured bacterium contig00038]